MHIQQIYTNCLSEASYYIESDGVAAVIDPIREPQPYLDMAKERGAEICYIFETHFHADFVSGHVDLAEQTGATIVFGPGAEVGYQAHIARDGEEFRIGKLTLRVLHTPGHTPESSCYLLVDENGKNQALFSGDTLFIGDVGRPDLAVKSDLTMEQLAGMLYESIHHKILPLEDDIMVYPAHGPGSACGKNIGKETFALLGQQKQTNYALQPMSREDFIETVSTGILPAPRYFSIAAGINKGGYDSLDNVLENTARPLSADQVAGEIEKGALLLDVRTPDEFEKGFIPGAVNIGLNGQFAIWAGTLLDYRVPVILLTPAGKEQETITRLARVGIENIKGYLEGGWEAWTASGKSTGTVQSYQPEDLKKLVNEGWEVLDVRKPGEYEGGHLEDAISIHLQALEDHLDMLSPEQPYAVHCAGGYRSMIAVSILKRKGFKRIANIYKGWGGIKEVEGLAKETGPARVQVL